MNLNLRSAASVRHRSAAPPLAALTLASSFAPATPAGAHPLGNASVNQHSRIEVAADRITVTYVMDLAEIPTLRERPLLDADGDGAIANEEQDGYLDRTLAEVVPSLHPEIDGKPQPLTVIDRSFALHDGQSGLSTSRVQATLRAPLRLGEAASHTLEFRNDRATDRLGCREIVLANGDGIGLGADGAATTDPSNGLTAYPEELLSSPPTSGRFRPPSRQTPR